MITLAHVIDWWKRIPWWAWIGAGGIVVALGGIPLFIAWLLPGVPPPGPFG